MNATTYTTLRRIDLTVIRLIRTHDLRPSARHAGFLEARKRPQLARTRRLLELQ